MCRGLSRQHRRRPPRRVVERAGVAMGSELQLTRVDHRRSGGALGVRRGVRRIRAARSADEHVAARQRRAADQRRGRCAAGAGQRRRAGRAAPGAADQRVDRGHVRRHLRRADRRLEVRSRSGQFHSRSEDAIRARLPLIDYRRIEIDDRAGTVFLDAQGDDDPSRRHRQGLRGRARDADPPRGRPARFHDPGRRRPVRRRTQGRPAVAPRHQRSARAGGQELRDDRSDRQHASARQATTHASS